MSLDFWYDTQLRRYWMQFGRIFEGIQYESGIGAEGVKTLRTFPVNLANRNRQVGWILRNGSENTILSTPRITFEMTEIEQNAERRQVPNHVNTVNVYERNIDPTTNLYTSDPGKTYQVERYMAIPYDMTMKVYIWTSNEHQKHQFMEQILVLFNPAIDLQTGTNPLDWTSLTYVELTGISWTNRDLPIGIDDDIEISALTFKVPIWLTPPAKVKRQNIIEQIILNIGNMDTSDTYISGQYGGYQFSNSDLYSRMIITPGMNQVNVDVVIDPQNNRYCEVTLLSPEGHELISNWREQAAYYGIDIDINNLPNPVDNRLVYNWRELLIEYGQFRPGVSQFRLKTNSNMEDHESDIVGIFDLHPTDNNKMIWTIDPSTLPQNTLQTIQGMVDLDNPSGSSQIGRWPGDGVLPEAIEGQRYLLASNLPADPRWTNLQASVNDIIEFTNGQWSISFDASMSTTTEVVLNQKSNKQLRWIGGVWTDAISGNYFPGYWRLFI